MAEAGSSWKRCCLACGVFLAVLAASSASAASRCFGTVGHGRIEGSVQLPARGANFAAYSLLAEHLYQLDLAAQARGLGIALVIFDGPYLPRLFATPRGPCLQRNLTLMKGKPWVRHDEHHHVDFAVPCRPKAG